jgi:hypothetical protein
MKKGKVNCHPLIKVLLDEGAVIKGIRSNRKHWVKKTSNMGQIIGINVRMAKMAKSEHILHVFSALDDVIELIPFTLFQASQFREGLCTSKP